MATAQSSPSAAIPPAVAASAASARGVAAPANRAQAAAAPSQAAAAQALVLVPPMAPEEDQRLLEVARLLVELDVVVPVAEFRVRNLLALEPGRVIQSHWNYGEDVPLSAGKVELARTEFEVIGDQLAVRITRLP